MKLGIGVAKASRWATSGSPVTGLGQHQQAIDFYGEQLQIARSTNDRHGEGNALWNMSLALDEVGERKKAIEFARSGTQNSRRDRGHECRQSKSPAGGVAEAVRTNGKRSGFQHSAHLIQQSPG